MARHLTDKEKKKIIKDYVEIENYSQVARRHKISANTVKRVVKGDKKTERKVRHKKEQNVQDVLAYMDKKKNDVNELIDLLLNAMKDPEKIENSSLRELATAMGIVIDKFTANELNKNKQDGTDGGIKIIIEKATKDDIEDFE